MRITLNHIYYHKWKKRLIKNQYQIDLDEQILLRRLSEGDRTAFWQLWIRYQKYIYYRCHGWMKNNYDDTEYAFNQVMLQTWNRLPNAAGKITNIRGWLSRLASDACIEIRQEHRKIAQHIDSLGLDEDMVSASRELQCYSQSQVLSPETIACSEWEKYIYFALERLSSQEL